MNSQERRTAESILIALGDTVTVNDHGLALIKIHHQLEYLNSNNKVEMFGTVGRGHSYGMKMPVNIADVIVVGPGDPITTKNLQSLLLACHDIGKIAVVHSSRHTLGAPEELLTMTPLKELPECILEDISRSTDRIGKKDRKPHHDRYVGRANRKSKWKK